MYPDEQTMNEVDKAVSLLTGGKAAEAAIAFTELLNKDNTNHLVWNNRGLALMELGHPFDGAINIEKAIALQPDASYYLNLGACYAEQELMPRAMACYEEALKLNPKMPVVHMNMANVLKFIGRPREALKHYRKCIELDPNYVDGHLFRAFTELQVGNYKDGWDEFEWRWKSNQLVPRGLAIKEWQGEPLKGKTLLIYGEQGHGDSLQFVRYAKLVREKYNPRSVYFEVRQPCVRLFNTVEGIDRVIPYGEKVPEAEIDYMVAVMSLPRIFCTRVDTIPWSGPYFKPDDYRAMLWHEKLKDLPSGLLVGLCWAGLSRPGKPRADAVDRKRSLSLEAFAPLAKVPGISWVSLQKGIPRDQVMTPPAGMTIGDWSDHFDDFFDTAALISCLDLVITVDTAVVHLAAGLGKPTWLLSRWDGCWRWLENRPDSPWYPTVRVFGQPASNAWDPCIKDVAKALREYVKAQSLRAA